MSTVHTIVHESIAAMKKTPVVSCIQIRSGRQLNVTVAGLQAVAGRPKCAGAVDGTSVHMLKPGVCGDTYGCYKKYIAIQLLAVCDREGGGGGGGGGAFHIH